MTEPPVGVRERLADVVRGMRNTFVRRKEFTPEERTVAIHLRGNEVLYKALASILESRIEGRAHLPVPSNPQECMASMVRDKELRWVLAKLDSIYRAPLIEEAEDQ